MHSGTLGVQNIVDFFLYFILDKCYGVFILCFVLFLLLGIYNLMLSKTFIIQTSKMHLYVFTVHSEEGDETGMILAEEGAGIPLISTGGIHKI